MLFGFNHLAAVRRNGSRTGKAAVYDAGACAQRAVGKSEISCGRERSRLGREPEKDSELCIQASSVGFAMKGSPATSVFDLVLLR